MHDPRVLIVENDERVCRVLSRIFTRMGYAAIAAADYESFKVLYQEQIPAVILLNLEIAGSGNTEFCRYLVEQKSGTAIMLLSDMEEEETADLLNLGSTAGLNMLGVLRKPVDVVTVKALLGQYVCLQTPHPLKKSLGNEQKLQPRRRPGVVTLDPDQKPAGPYNFIFDTELKSYSRTIELTPSLQGVFP